MRSRLFVVIAACLALPLAVPGMCAGYLAAPGFAVSAGERPGYLFFSGENVTLGLSVVPPDDGADVLVDGTIVAIPDSPDIEASTAVRATLTKAGGYKSPVALKLPGLGYYEVTWALTYSGTQYSPGKTTLAVIPKNPQDKQRPGSPFGINVHRWWQGPYMPVVRRLGIAWVRDHMAGHYTKETGEYGEIDPNLLEAEANKLCYLSVSEYFERGATDLQEVNGTWVMPSAAKQVEAYARKNRGRVTHFELYNEPHGFGWGTRFDPGGPLWSGGKWVKPFVDFGIAQTKALHRGDPNMKMVWPELDIFLHTKLFEEQGAKPYIQAIAPHTYSIHSDSPEHQGFLSSMPENLKYIHEHGLPTEIWATEVGFSSFSDNISRPDGYLGYRPQTETLQAEKLARVMILHGAAGITKTFWYDFYEDGDEVANAECHFGIMRYNPLLPHVPVSPAPKPNPAKIAHDTYEPKPAAVAYCNVINWLEGAKWLGKFPSGGWVYAFQRRGKGGPVLVAWVEKAEKSEVYVVNSGVRKVTITDLYGRSREVNIENGRLPITLTESPVFVTGLKASDIVPLVSPLVR